MTAALGSGGVVLALVAALGGIVTLVTGITQSNPRRMAQGRMYGWLVLAGAVLATVAMETALLRDDFSVRYVAEHSATTTPLLYKIASMWGALEGSILLWGLVLACYTALVLWRFRNRVADPMVAWALVVMFVVVAFFFGLMVGPADPFVTTSVVPSEGLGPNVLLQNHPLMAIHPPMLYIGYVGFTVPFAFAIAALATGRLGEGWLVETRRWTLVAWGALTLGIVLGAWWSYEVLGWGGYWAWDPVENASLLPWLTGTAYLHSVVVQEQRGMLRVWNISLLVATFSLTILGTFLTRSGVIESVHAFADGAVGPALLGFFAVIVAVSLGLIVWRSDTLRSLGAIESPVSREGSFLVNNLLFASFAFMVLLGTVFPLLVEAVNDEQIAVGTPFFDRMGGVLGLAILFLMAVSPLLPWRRAGVETLRERLLVPAWAGGLALSAALVLGAHGLTQVLGFGLAGFAAASAMRQLSGGVRRHRLRGLTGRTYGGMVVHLGVVIVAVALIASRSFSTDSEFALAEGETALVGGHEVTYLGSSVSEQDNFSLVSLELDVDGEEFAPGVQRFPNGRTVGVPSVKTGFQRDVYLVATQLPEGDGGELQLRVIIQPMIMWLWIGGIVMVVGTALAALPGPGPGSPSPSRVERTGALVDA